VASDWVSVAISPRVMSFDDLRYRDAEVLGHVLTVERS